MSTYATPDYKPVRYECTPLEMHERLLGQMGVGLVIFSFLKINGTIKTAVGTLSPEWLPPAVTPTTPKKEVKKSITTQVYYDLPSKSWKSYRIDSLLSITQLY